MTFVPLLGGNFQGRSIQASAQNLAVNCYPERQPPDGQPLNPVTYYTRPGLLAETTSPTVETVRTAYRATNGNLYVVVGPSVYSVSSTFTWTLLGTVPDLATPIICADNGLAIVLVDGSATGYAIDMATNAFGTITDPNFLGALYVSQQDGFFIFNKPGTNDFYISLNYVTFDQLTGVTGRILSGSIVGGGSGYVSGSYANVPLTGGTGSGATANITVSGGGVTAVTLVNAGTGYTQNDTLSANASDLGGSGSGFAYGADSVATAFDPLDIATKSSVADPIVVVTTIHGVLWLIGELTTEIWAPSGAADFYFQRIPGAVVNHGCAAPYSISQYDISLFWLSQDAQGHGVVVKGEGDGIVRISTNDIEAEIQKYATISDAIGFCHQVEGHAFYVLTFPGADVTWCYDLSTQQWHKRVSIDANGVQHRWRANCFAFAFGLNLVGDYQNGKVYSLSSTIFLDDTIAVPRVVTFPHLLNEGKRVIYNQFMAKFEVGASSDPAFDPPQASLSWSDDGGVTYGNPVMQSLGAAGQYLTAPQWQRLGLARDRIFKLTWDTNVDTALTGAWVQFTRAAT